MAFQINKKNNTNINTSIFNHCNLTNVKSLLNNLSSSYGNLNLNVNKNQHALLYEMYVHFQANYYGKEPQPLLSRGKFTEHAPVNMGMLTFV